MSCCNSAGLGCLKLNTWQPWGLTPDMTCLMAPTLGDGNLALAREQPNRAHLAQIHAHRVVGALDRLLGLEFSRRVRRDPDEFAGLGFLALGLLAHLLLVGLGLLGLDHVDAHLIERR
jgi:hypothetical protein